MNKSIKILIKWLVALLLTAGLFYFLYKKINGQEDFTSIRQLLLQAMVGSEAWKSWLIIILVFLNWGIESYKWKLLVSTIQSMPLLQSIKSVLCGITLTFFTPNRIGEYGGRVFFIKEGHRLQAVSLSVAGSIAQLIITLIIGSLGLLYLLLAKKLSLSTIGIHDIWLTILIACCLLVTILLCLFYFKMAWLTKWVERFSFTRPFVKHIAVLEKLDVKILLSLLALSTLRYFVFALQYIFMLQLMQVEQNSWQSFWLVSVMFLLLAIIPSFAIAELGIRGAIATSLFAYTGNVLGILTVTFGIWLINLFLPALAGSLLILGIKTSKTDD